MSLYTANEAIATLSGYYHNPLSETELELYLRHLDGISARALQYAVDTWIEREKWFPKISALLDLADKWQPAPWEMADRLAIAQQNLVDEFTQTGELDQGAWEALIDEYKQADRPARADSLRRRLAGLRASVGFSQWQIAADVLEAV